MQKTTITYSCDNCQKVLSDNKINKKHLSFNFQGKNQGWVSACSGNRGTWTFLSRLNMPAKNEGPLPFIYQFCDYKCFAKFFDELVAKSQLNKLKE